MIKSLLQKHGKTNQQPLTLQQYMWAGADPEGSISSPKTCETIFFAMNLENTIHDISPFCRPLFCHSSVVKYTSSLLQ